MGNEKKKKRKNIRRTSFDQMRDDDARAFSTKRRDVDDSDRAMTLNEQRKKKIKETVEKFKDYSVPSMTCDEAIAATKSSDDDKKIVFVDCREKEERDVSAIPNAMTVAELERDAKDIANEKKICACYCTVGFRSQQLVKRLRKEYPDLDSRNLEGSIVMWTHTNDATLVKANEENNSTEQTKNVHVYGSTWDLARDDYYPIVHKVPLFNAIKAFLFSRK